ncbi:hypothetical protein NKH77_16840 [Streptomyces sp. M19]
MLNPAPMTDEVSALLDRVDVLVPNESELRALLRRDTPIGPDEAAAAVRQTPGRATWSRRSAVRGLRVRARARPRHAHRAATGAGAGHDRCGRLPVRVLAAELAAGAELLAAAETAVCLASLSTTRPGARWTRPTDDTELDTLRSTVRRTVIPG